MPISPDQILQYFSENLKGTYSSSSQQAQEMKLKFEYAVITLIFASLALSLQFSPSFGAQYRGVLLLSWIVLLSAGIAGGYRLMLLPEYMRLSGIQDYLDKRVRMGSIILGDPECVTFVNAGRMVDPDSFRPHTVEGLKAGHKKDDEYLKIVNEQLASLEWKLPCAFYIQVWGLIISYAILTIFISINFL